MRLQRFGIDESQYERPDQKWICGWTAKGCPCVEGPDDKGMCRGTAECIPVRRGDRWHCQRHEGRGGTCDTGPLPDGRCCLTVTRCQPVRSLRAKRGFVGFWVIAATAGFIFYIVGSPWHRNSVISPGALSSSHGILGNDCASCHTAMKEGTLDWSRLKTSAAVPAKDSNLCVECHDMGVASLNAHSLLKSDLADITERIATTGEKSSRSLDPILSFINEDYSSKTHNEALACATCHREHRGRDHQLTEMGNQRCQTCHVYKFDSFPDGHPEFSGYPFEARTAIIFDHYTHISEHFVKDSGAAVPSSCLDCHQPDSAGRRMLVRDFSVTCAGCHDDQIRGHGQMTKSVSFLQLPGIDVETFAERGIEVGRWPEDADGDITPFMRLLLSSDPAIRSALNRITDIELYDLADTDDEQIESAGQVVIAIKNLIYKIETEGHSYFNSRLRKLPGNSLDDRQLRHLAGGLPVDTITKAREQWFPDLARELSGYTSGDKSIEPEFISKPPDLPRPELGNQPPQVVPPTSADSDEDILADTDDILDDDDILGGDDEDLLAEDSTDIIDLSDDEIIGEDIDAGNGVANTATQSLPKSPEEWVHTGGWYQANYSLNYRPTGHSDDFIESWLTITSILQTGSRRIAAASDVFTTLAGRQSVGLCSKCHSVDSQADGTLAVNWHSRISGVEQKPFTKFSHSAHFNVVDREGCMVCHELNRNADYAATFKRFDRTVFHGNFKDIKRDSCSTCHVPELAGNRCLDCHNYHVRESSFSQIDSSFSSRK